MLGLTQGCWWAGCRVLCTSFRGDKAQQSWDGGRGVKPLHAPHWHDITMLLFVNITNHSSDHICLWLLGNSGPNVQPHFNQTWLACWYFYCHLDSDLWSTLSVPVLMCLSLCFLSIICNMSYSICEMRGRIHKHESKILLGKKFLEYLFSPGTSLELLEVVTETGWCDWDTQDWGTSRARGTPLAMPDQGQCPTRGDRSWPGLCWRWGELRPRAQRQSQGWYLDGDNVRMIPRKPV